MSRSTIRSASLKPASTSPNVNVSAASAFFGNLPWSTSAMSAAVHFNVRMLGPTNTLPCSRPFGDPGRRPSSGSITCGNGFEGDDDAIDRFGGELFAVGGDRENRLALVDRFFRQCELGGHRRRSRRCSRRSSRRRSGRGCRSPSRRWRALHAGDSAGAAPDAFFAGGASPSAFLAGGAAAGGGAGGGGGAGRSSAVRMPCTPGIASAADASMLMTRACGRGLGISLTNTMPSARKSSAYFARPVTLATRSGVT